MYSASQVFSGLDLNAVESHEIFSLNENSSWNAFSENTMNTEFQFSREILEVSAERSQNDSSKAIFEVRHSVAIPLIQDLKLSFSIFARQLNVNADAGRVYLVLQNGTDVVLLNYVVGYKETDWKHGTSSYFFYKVENNTSTWSNDERNVWNDVIGKNVTLKSPWEVTSIAFGCISYWKEPSINTKMDILFDANETSLYYEKSSFTKVIPTTRISWLAVYEMIAGMLLFVFCSVILIKTQKQLRAARVPEREQIS